MGWLARVFAAAAVRRVAVVVVGLMVAAIAQCAHAAGTVTPITTTKYQVCSGQGWSVAVSSCTNGTSNVGGPWDTRPLACEGYRSWIQGQHGGPTTISTCPNSDGAIILSNPSVSGGMGSLQFTTCPANATQSGQTCTCNANFQPNGAGTACEPVPDVCADKLAKPLGAPGQEFVYPISGPGAPSRVCQGGCGYIPGASGVRGMWTKLLGPPVTYNYVATSADDWIGDGTSCTAAPVGSPGTPPTTPPQPDPTPPPEGKCEGTVNGVTVIVECDATGTSSGTNGPGSSSGAASGAGGSSTTGTTSSTTCSGGTCTTTTTTTTTNEGGTSTETETQTEDKGDFCAEHPGNPQCSAEDDPSDPCDDAPDRAGCKNLGTLEATPLQTSVVPLAITPSTGYGPSNATCPAPQTATLLGHTYSFSWQPFCDLATGIRPVVLALAWVSAAIGFLGLSRKGS